MEEIQNNEQQIAQLTHDFGAQNVEILGIVIDPEMVLPNAWMQGLSWYHRQIAQTTGDWFYNRARVKIWEAELQFANYEKMNFPAEVRRERIERRKIQGLYNCYRQIHLALRIPADEPITLNPIETIPNPEILARFDNHVVPAGDIIEMIVDNIFRIREALPFIMPADFLDYSGPIEQRFLVEQAYERYKEACENLVWGIDRIREFYQPTRASIEIYELVKTARREWNIWMRQWIDGKKSLINSVLIKLNDYEFIPRQLNALWEVEEMRRLGLVDDFNMDVNFEPFEEPNEQAPEQENQEEEEAKSDVDDN